jgi:small GTP-binding protein
MSESDVVFKILTIGESEVGKTCILRRFVENKFLKNHLSTIGIDFRTKAVNVCGKNIKLKIWDTAGQERYHNITNQIYKGADGIIVVFSVIDEESFAKVKEWMEQITSNIKKEEVNLILLGNKCDLEERVITKEQGKQMADNLGINYYETSALDGTGINEAFEGLTKEIMKKKAIITDDNRPGSFSLNNDKNKKKKRGCCQLL